MRNYLAVRRKRYQAGQFQPESRDIHHAGNKEHAAQDSALALCKQHDARYTQHAHHEVYAFQHIIEPHAVCAICGKLQWDAHQRKQTVHAAQHRQHHKQRQPPAQAGVIFHLHGVHMPSLPAGG